MKATNLLGRGDFSISAQSCVVYFLPAMSDNHITCGMERSASPRLGEKLLLGSDYDCSHSWNLAFLADSPRVVCAFNTFCHTGQASYVSVLHI